MTGFLNWVSNLPAHWGTNPLRAVADYTVSNVDKVPAGRRKPLFWLCNYTDVYNNEFIMLLSRLHAGLRPPKGEIEKFGLEGG